MDRSWRGVRGLWIVEEEGERVVCRFERRAVVLCSLVNEKMGSVKGILEGKGVREREQREG